MNKTKQPVCWVILSMGTNQPILSPPRSEPLKVVSVSPKLKIFLGTPSVSSRIKVKWTAEVSPLVLWKAGGAYLFLNHSTTHISAS